jgi:hypothetical protein
VNDNPICGRLVGQRGQKNVAGDRATAYTSAADLRQLRIGGRQDIGDMGWGGGSSTSSMIADWPIDHIAGGFLKSCRIRNRNRVNLVATAAITKRARLCGVGT